MSITKSEANLTIFAIASKILAIGRAVAADFYHAIRAEIDYIRHCQQDLAILVETQPKMSIMLLLLSLTIFARYS